MDETAMNVQTLYAVLYTPGPEFERLGGREADLQARHVDYQVGHFKAGRLLLGGPYAARQGGIALFRAASQEEVERIVAADPAVTGGFYVAEVRAWEVVLNGCG